MKKKKTKEVKSDFLKSVQLVADVFGLHAYVVDGKVTIGDFKPKKKNEKEI